MKIGTALAVAAVLLLTGCTYNRGLIVSSADHGPNDKVVGIVRGQSEKDYFLFGLIQPGDDSLGAAFADAIEKSSAPAQGLIDVFAEKYCTYYLPPLFWSCGTSLTGAAIQYAELGARRIQTEEDFPTRTKILTGDFRTARRIQSEEDIPPPARPGTTFGDCPKGQTLQNGFCHPLTPGR